MKKFCLIALIISTIFLSGYKKTDEVYVIDAEQNAYIHNNRGLIHLKENAYYSAIEEFKIAISLSPDVQASATFYNNLGETYMKLEKPDLAQDCFEKALQQFPLNFRYYQNIAQCYFQLGYAQEQIQRSYEDRNPLGLILRGLLYELNGDNVMAITALDEFAAKEPDLIITESVKQYLQELVKKTY
ncbi:tetratricopeptide repeat protein [bacterium]|nr:tetratricopeptide repeat protein [bacterium]